MPNSKKKDFEADNKKGTKRCEGSFETGFIWEGGVNNFCFLGGLFFAALELRAIVETIFIISWLLLNLKSSMGDFDIFKSLGEKSLRGVGPFCESMHLKYCYYY